MTLSRSPLCNIISLAMLHQVNQKQALTFIHELILDFFQVGLSLRIGCRWSLVLFNKLGLVLDFILLVFPLEVDILFHLFIFRWVSLCIQVLEVLHLSAIVVLSTHVFLELETLPRISISCQKLRSILIVICLLAWALEFLGGLRNDGHIVFACKLSRLFQHICRLESHFSFLFHLLLYLFLSTWVASLAVEGVIDDLCVIIGVHARHGGSASVHAGGLWLIQSDYFRVGRIAPHGHHVGVVGHALATTIHSLHTRWLVFIIRVRQIIYSSDCRFSAVCHAHIRCTRHVCIRVDTVYVRPCSTVISFVHLGSMLWC